MWNEHCSYKSSKVHLRTLPTKAPWVIQGPGENAGVIDIGDGLAVRVQDGEPQPPELHRALSGRGDRRRRHPARRVHHGRAADRLPQRAVASAIPTHPKTRHLVSGVVAGIGGYGNSFGVPTVGGSGALPHALRRQQPGQRHGGRPRRDRQDFLRGGVRRRHADRLSRLQDRPRRHPRRQHGVGRVRRGRRGEAPDRAGRRSVLGKAAARSLPRDHGARAA